MKHLTLSFILVVITTVVGVGWLVSEFYSNLSDQLDNSDPLNVYKVVAKDLALTLDQQQNKESWLQNWNENSQTSIQLLARKNFPIPETLIAEFESGEALVLATDNDLSIHIFLPISNQVMSLSLPPGANAEQETLLNLILTIAFYLGVILIVLLWLYPLIKNLMVLRKTAKEFGEGRLSSRVIVKRFSYIADIEKEFNRMADRIESLINDNKLLSSAVSHDLKTPLARLRFGLDTLAETQNPKLQEKYLKRIDQDLCAMESLVEILLQYARLDSSNIQLDRKTIEVKSFIEKLLQRLQPSYISIEFQELDNKAMIVADPNYLAMQINNLLHNAINHAKHSILIRVMEIDERVVISIEDDGDGIEEKERTEVIKPFWRSKNNPNNQGHGMGLAIVNRISEWHNNKLIIGRSESLRGAAVQLVFDKSDG